MINALTGFIGKRPLLVFVTMVLLTCIPGYYALKGLSLNVVLEEMLPAAAHNVQLYKRFSAQFGGANTTLIEIKTNRDSIYNPAFLEKYRRIAEDIYFHPDSIRHLNQSLALRKTKAVYGQGGSVEIEAIMWPNIPKTEEDMLAFRRSVNNQYRGFLVSDDERSAMAITDFKDEADAEKILDFFEEIRANEEDENTSIHVVGRPILLGYIYKSLDTVYIILLCSVLIIALVLYLYFRTWIGVLVPMFTATIATIWGLGAMGATGYNLDPLLILLPAFIFAIVLSHGVQLTSRVLENLEANPGQMKDCTKISLAVLLIPSTAAIITDAAGFGGDRRS